MAVNITRSTSGSAEIIVASDQMSGNDFAAVSVDVVVDYTAAVNRMADALDAIILRLESIDAHIQEQQNIVASDPFGSVALYKLFIEQGGILDTSKSVDGETMVKSQNELKIYHDKITELIQSLGM